MFYNKKPKGLNGALQDLGIQFEGREHSGTTNLLKFSKKRKNRTPILENMCDRFCLGSLLPGLDDSRNTAQLAARMMRDGCVMKITKSLGRVSGYCPLMRLVNWTSLHLRLQMLLPMMMWKFKRMLHDTKFFFPCRMFCIRVFLKLVFIFIFLCIDPYIHM